MATAKKLPSGQYRVRAYIGMDENGRKITKSFTASSKKKAEFLASQYVLTAKVAVESPTKKGSFDEAMTRYIDSRRNVIAPYSLTSYLSI